MPEEQTDYQVVRLFLLNKKEDIERLIKESGEDMWKNDVDRLISRIQNDHDSIYNRRKEIEGFGIVNAEGKWADLLQEAKDSYLLGHYYSTIALSSMAAERICYDYIEFSQIQINGTTISDKAKQELIYLPLNHLIDFLHEYGIIDGKSKGVLHRISQIRNTHVHPKMSGDSQKDAIEVLNLLCNVAENLWSMFKTHNIVDGKFVKKHEPSQS
jgi:hypothetical protein